MDSLSQPPRESSANLVRATSAQVYDRRVRRLTAIVFVALAATGCAREDDVAELPAACESEPAAYVEALDAAPNPVRVEGVPISECLAHGASVGDVQLVGSALVEAARRLGEDGRSVPLGYLVGAMRRETPRDQGVYLELVRRVEQEAGPLVDAPGYERGLRAGRSSG